MGEQFAKREQNIIIDSKDPIVQGGFTQIPNFILRDRRLSHTAKLAYTMFLSYAWNNEFCFPGQERLAEDIGITEKTLRKYILELKATGLLTVKKRGQGKTDLYVIKFQVKDQKKRAQMSDR